MKVLWLSNVIFPEASLELKINAPVVGGWMHSAAIALLESNKEIKLAVVALYPGKVLKCINNYTIQYYLIPTKGDQRYDVILESYYQRINEEFTPDLVHIHGTEYPHSLAWIKACGIKKVAVSIQGLVSVYTKYYMGGISQKEINGSITFRDFIRNDSLLKQQNKMRQRGRYEYELLKNINYIIGRTSWDKSNTWAINSDASYYLCNETLRGTFYNFEWKFENCEKHTIFLSQAHYPIKGIHQVINALPIVLRHFPDTRIYVAGNNFISTSIFTRNGFANYLTGLIKNYGIGDKFIFMGLLNEEDMAKQYLKANVFVCPSSIENSPNSVGEAQLLGLPCIASYVGGNMDMIKDHETGFLYRFEETSLLAMRICEIFANQNLAEKLSKNSRIIALKRHDKKQNAESLNQIYRSILNENTSDL